MKNRIFGLLLGLALCLVLLPAVTLTARAEAEVSTYEDLTNALSTASTNEDSPTEIKLAADIKTSAALTVASNTYVIIDLNGHTIDRGLSNTLAVEDGYVISVRGTLTITDSRTGGKITGGNNIGIGSCGGVYVYSGTFIMNGGTISGNDATSPYTSYYGGGGVCVVNGTFTMNDGTIANNTGIGGGGVFVHFSTFTMNGGTIEGNRATGEYSSGGGVYVYSNGTFTMKGGTIANNTGICTGGVWNGGTFRISGAPIITGNTAGAEDNKTANNVYLYNDGYNITVAGALTDAASIGVTIASGLTLPYTFTEYLKSTGNSSNFISDNSDYGVVFDSSYGEAMLVSPPPLRITTQPIDKTFYYGQSDTLYVETTQSYATTTYQWYSSETASNSGGTKIVGATSDTYAIPADNGAGTYYYYCVITSTDGTLTATVKSDVAKVTVNPRPLTIQAAAQSKTYGEEDPTLTYSNSALMVGDELTGALTRAAGEDVGTYAITQGTLTAGDNYSISYTGANLTITKAASTVKTPPTANTLTYTGDPQELVSAGTPDGGTMQYRLSSGSWGDTIPTATNAGTYTVYYRVVGDDNHNNNAGGSVTVTISPAMLTVNLTDKELRYEIPTVLQDKFAYVIFVCYNDKAQMVSCQMISSDKADGTIENLPAAYRYKLFLVDTATAPLCMAWDSKP